MMFSRRDILRAPLGISTLGIGCGNAAVGPSYNFATDPSIISWYEPDNGFADKTPNATFDGALVSVGTSVPIGGNLEGHSLYQVTAKTATTGFLRSTNWNTATVFAVPVYISFIGRFTGSPTINVRLVSSGFSGGSLNYNDATHLVANGGGDYIFSAQPLSFHWYQILYLGKLTFVSIDGGAWTKGDISTGGLWQGVAFGARGSDGALPSDCEIAHFLKAEGWPSAAFTTGLGAYLKGRFPALLSGMTSATALAASNFDTIAPAAFDYTQPWNAMVDCLVQSNASNFSTVQTAAVGSNIYTLGNDHIWRVMPRDQWDSPTNQVFAISQDSVATIGSSAASLANVLQPGLDGGTRPLIMVPNAKSASYIVPGALTSDSNWNREFRRGLHLPNSLYWQSVFRAKQVLKWGGTIRVIRVLQGESEAQSASAPIRAAWPATVHAYVRQWCADVGIPNPYDNPTGNCVTLIQQIAQKSGNANWNDFQTNVQPTILTNARQIFVPTVSSPTFEADGIHYDGPMNDRVGAAQGTAALAALAA